MLKSLLLAAACAYVNPPGLQPNVVQIQAVSGMDLEFNPFADNLCSEVVLEPVTSEALDAFIDPTATWHLNPVAEVIPLPRPRPKAIDAFAMEPPTIDPRSGNQGRKFGLPGKDSDYRKYQ
jgi:hypothetical protein